MPKKLEKTVELNFGKEWDKKETKEQIEKIVKEPIKRMPFKPLIAFPSPRDIQEVKDAVADIPYMKLWIKYHPAPEAYTLIRNYFLENDSFSHLIMNPDDLVVTKEKLDILIEDIQNMPDTHYDNSVVCGFCNINTRDQKELANISHYLQPQDRSKRNYRFLTLEECRNFPIPPENPKILGENLKHLFRVKFAGFPAMIIPRNIVKNIVFRNDSESGSDESGCCLDVMFCYDMHVNDYDIFIDKRVEFKHLREDDVAILPKDLKGKHKHIIWDNGESNNKKIQDQKGNTISYKDDDYGF
jgi:hypothetical protein